jgi:hypothetical protein
MAAPQKTTGGHVRAAASWDPWGFRREERNFKSPPATDLPSHEAVFGAAFTPKDVSRGRYAPRHPIDR